MIRKLDWDSNLFGYNVGEFIFDGHEWFKPEEARDFNLIYVISDNEIANNPSRLSLVDLKTSLVRSLDGFSASGKELIETSFNEKDKAALFELALQSGEWSRFKTDTGFKNGEFKKLYAEWIKGSVEGRIADFILTERNETTQIIGFVTIGMKNDIGKIGLIAVDSKYRGMGVGGKLIARTLALVKSMGGKEVKVITQFANKSAMALYLKNGFEIESQKYIYHWWRSSHGL
ncbi:MAG TPA: GNAT family N-acetyltransferase [Niabella sp.]|nr:GNAT family N-acetyltransferase [Chitinophagaceae bacterium]HUN02304.1 GNAT family N-acetyltransferase [Niabella sp.]